MFEDWLAALEARHLADLRVQEVTRALRALSSAYVERRRAPAGSGALVRSTLDGAGKRAAFALFYAPLHFLTIDAIVRALAAHTPAPRSILDIGCGTGAGGAAWAVAAAGTPPVTGIDRHPWAVEEARWTYAAFGLRGRAKRGDAARLPRTAAGDAIVAGYVLNEMPDLVRRSVEDQLLRAAGRGVRVLVVEPIARGITPWWETAAARVREAGGRADEWRFATALPPLLRTLDAAAGLDHRELTARSLYCPGVAG